LDLSSPVLDVIPELVMAANPDYSQAITLEHTLTHQGGLYDFLLINTTSRDQALKRFMTGWYADNQFYIAPPGAMWNYSNPNFYIAGLMTEVASGRYYASNLTRSVFEPLRMTRTYFYGDEVLSDGNYAVGFSAQWSDEEGNPWVTPDGYDNAWGRPAGYAWSSVTDLARFGQFLMDGDRTVLSDSLREGMMQPHVSLEVLGDDASYGHGLFVWDGFALGDAYYPIKVVEHGGDIPGFAANVVTIPELNRGVAVLASADLAHFGNSIAFALSMGTLPEPTTPPDHSPDPTTYSELVGWYDEPNQITGPMEVSRDGTVLTVRFPLVDKLNLPYEETLIPYTKDNFILEIQGYQMLLTFLRGDDGAVTFARTRLFVATQSDSRPTPWREALAEIDPDAFTSMLRNASDGDRPLLESVDRQIGR